MNNTEQFYKIEELAMNLDTDELHSLAVRMGTFKVTEHLAEVAKSYIEAISDAPRHNGLKCITHIVYGNCPHWPHG